MASTVVVLAKDYRPLGSLANHSRLGVGRLLQSWRPWTFMPVLKSIDANAVLASPQPARAAGSFPWGFALIMGALAALGPFSVDTYFPSFPAIASHFGVSQLQVQSTLSLYLTALALMSLFHGALSDSFGRRRVILVSLVVYTLMALACPLAPSFGWLLGFRFVQGLAGGAGMIVGRAIIRDRFHGPTAHRFMAQVTLVSGFAPAIAPVLGGWLHVWFGWRGPFMFLSLMGTVILLACFFMLPESLPRESRQAFHPAPLTEGYWSLVRHPGFVALCLAVGLGGGGFLLYVATAPDMVLNVLSLSETQFAWLFAPLVVGLLSGSALTTRLAGRVPIRRVAAWGYGLMSLAVALNVLGNLVFRPRVPWAVAPLFIYTLGFSLFAPIGTLLALELFPHRRGMASSLQGFVQIILFAAISAFVAPVVYASGLKHALAMAVMLVLNCLAWRFFRLRHELRL
jgi:DHA1 family bicyclomycin/chloramphenicol resistance-like MFS transporter